MEPLGAGLIGGGASLLGSFFSSSTSASNTAAQIAAQQAMQGQAEQFNASQAQLQRDYATQMSNTAYQRASADMTKAGLNPMMMFGSGGPSSTPGVGAASVGTPNVPMPQKTNPLAGVGDAVKAGLTSMIDAKSIDVLTQKVANMRTEQDLTRDQDLKTMQNITSDLPKEKAGQVLGEFMARHPDLTTAAEVGKYGAGALSEVAGSVWDTLNPIKGMFSSGKGGRWPSSADDLSQGFSNSAKQKLRDYGAGTPGVLERLKRLEGNSPQGGVQ